jgi:hypothetical protein
MENPLATWLSKYGVGASLNIEYNRDGSVQNATVTLEAAPDNL